MKTFKMMKTLDVAEATGSLASHARSLRGEPVIAMIERSRATHKPGRGLSTTQMRRALGLKRAPQRKAG